MDVHDLEERTGWTIVHRPVLGSTNDAAAEGGYGPHTVVVADEQTGGRGREGRHFASPAGGLYASLLLDVPAEDMPAGAVALVALAGAEAIEAVTGAQAAIKWPNDLWLAERKVGGILLERRGQQACVIAGIGINVTHVPAGLPPALRPHVGALAEACDPPPTRDGLLVALLAAVDRAQARRRAPGGAQAIEAAWRGRQALIGTRVTCTSAGEAVEGVLEAISLARGLRIRDARSGPVWRPAEHVQDLRPAGRTI
ncbi:MAG: biotin--[acetyl-CoA-carboxylase] ligase [Planctomycetota bacterium]|nr:biotin--[acetyl-CoA-carboxylase] ligase [Planctomycetota bacterium]